MSDYHFYALGAAFSFSIASQIFTHYARKVSVMWMNCFKAVTALLAFSLVVALTNRMQQTPSPLSVSIFFLSGLIALNIGDWFLVKAFQTIGPARTLVIFSFQPIFIGIMAYIIFSQPLTPEKLIGIIFMISCVYVLSLERFKKEKKWELAGPIYALIGIILDTCGILLTRFAFDNDPSVSVMQGNLYRVLGAITGFIIMSKFVRIDLFKTYAAMSVKSQVVVFIGGILGTFVSLFLFLKAISIGHLATITSLTGAGPVFAAIFESIIHKKWPSRYLCIAFILFGIGFLFIIR